MYRTLEEINRRPDPFSEYTAEELWTDEHTSKKMLEFHLNGAVDISSRRTEFIDRSARWISSRFDLGKGKSVADFGCGPGLYTIRLAATGADITGIDFSERSIQYARETSEREGLKVEYIHGDYLTFESDRRFDLITMIMCDFCALSPNQRRIMLEKFHAHLKPGGHLLLDVYSLNAFNARKEEATYSPNLLDGFWSAEPYFGFLNTFKYDEEKVTLDKYTIIEEARTRMIYNWLQHFEPESLQRELETCGLVLDDLLGDVAGAPYDPSSNEFAIIVRKPS